MLQEAVYDLLVARPHEPEDARFTAAEFAIHRAGYELALKMALRTMEGATTRYKLYVLTRRLETRARNKVNRDQT